MKIGIFAPYHADWRITTTMDSVIEGFKQSKEDYFVQNLRFYKECDVAILFGIYSIRFWEETGYRKQIIDHHIKNKKPFIVIERGYLKRDQYYSFAVNGFGGRANFYNKNSSPDRFNKLDLKVKPWNENRNQAILIATQISWDTSVQHVNYELWLKKTMNDLRKMYPSKEIIFRPHPVRGIDIYSDEVLKVINRNKVQISTFSLEEDFQRSSSVMTFNSTTSVDAILEGVPVISHDDGCIVRNVTDHSIKNVENFTRFDRNFVFFNLAYTQWNWEEFAENKPWLRIRDKIENLVNKE
jgi:hypothetical protein